MALALQAVMEVKPHLQPETFQWKVALQEAPAPVASAATPRQEPVPEPARRPSLSPPVQQPFKAAVPGQAESCRETFSRCNPPHGVIERSAIQERQAVAKEKRRLWPRNQFNKRRSLDAQEVVQQDIHETIQSSDEFGHDRRVRSCDP